MTWLIKILQQETQFRNQYKQGLMNSLLLPKI